MGRTWTDEQLIAALRHSKTVADVCRSLGIVPRGGSYEVVRRHLRRLGLSVAGVGRLTDQQFAEVVDASRTLAEVADRAGMKTRWGARQRITRLGLDPSHFTGQGWRRGTSRPLAEILVLGVSMPDTARLRRRLITEGIKEPRCGVCGLTEWNGVPIPLELDHINGRRDDNRLENLRLICPNCHAQTPTYRGRNIGRYSSPESQGAGKVDQLVRAGRLESSGVAAVPGAEGPQPAALNRKQGALTTREGSRVARAAQQLPLFAGDEFPSAPARSGVVRRRRAPKAYPIEPRASARNTLNVLRFQ